LNRLTVGKVERYMRERLASEGAVHITLIDPDKSRIDAKRLAKEAEEGGTSAIMVGGSIGISEKLLDETVLSIKEAVNIPVILFPGNVTGISRHADAIWFMSLLNSANTYYLIDAQALGAVIVRRYGLEAIPMGYLIVGEGGAAGYIGHARVIPYNRPEIAAIYALAGELLGMRFIYLEAGSGAKTPIPPKMIEYVKKAISIPLIVGGGIKTEEQAKRAVIAGADAIVTGTIIETGNVKKKVKSIVKGIKEAAKERRLSIVL